MCDYLHWNEGISWWFSGWESACQCRGHGFDPWLGKIPYAMGQLSLSATTTMPMHLEPCSTTREASAMKSLCTAMKSSPHSLPREKAQAEQRRPSTAKNNNYIIKNKLKWNKAKDSVLLSHQSHFRWLTYWTVQMLDISITVESSTRKRRFRMFTCHIHHPGPWGWSLCTGLTSKPPHLTLAMILSCVCTSTAVQAEKILEWILLHWLINGWCSSSQLPARPPARPGFQRTLYSISTWN